MGFFYPFIEDESVNIIGIEAAGFGVDSGKTAATITKGTPGILHGSMSYLLHDKNGQIELAHSISAGLDYPGIGPEHSHLHDTGRVMYNAVTDDEAMEAVKLLSKKEGIIPALETAHAFAWLENLMSTTKEGQVVIVNCSGRGDKDMGTISENL
jgi:tryptophan synthase beta chain